MEKRVITLAEYYNIPLEKFKELGVLNPNLTVNTNMFIDPVCLAEAGISDLYMGGYVDTKGNVYREKDVLANDYSSPFLLAGNKYDAHMKHLPNKEQPWAIVSLNDIRGKEYSLILYENETEVLKKAGLIPA